MTVTFVDAGVLIFAARGSHRNSRTALSILDDSSRIFASSEFVRLEVLPKARFHRRTTESAFYEQFFQKVERWAPLGRSLVEGALLVGSEVGLSAMDALHVAAAIQLEADELITTEALRKPIHRVRGITVRTIHVP